MSATETDPPPVVMMIGSKGLAALLDCSLRHVEQLDVTHRLPKPVRLGRLKKWRLPEIERWVAAGCPPRHVWETLSATK
jgi:hypothetical protein